MQPAAYLQNPAWREALAPVLASDAFAELEAFLAAERAAHEVLPPPEQVFAALEATPPEAVRVVILGQDPYPTPGHAHGLAFSYRGAGRLPRSLANIFREIERDLGGSLEGHSGDLGAWAQQGVLLLNTVLTVRAGEAGSHRRKGWEALTEAIVRHLAAGDRPVAFLLWGGDARRRARLIGAPHLVLEAGHPSPLSIRHFRGCGHFGQVNDWLGDDVIDWSSPTTARPGS